MISVWQGSTWKPQRSDTRGLLAAAAVLIVVGVVVDRSHGPSPSTTSFTSTDPPPAGGYFTTLVRPDNVAALPDGNTCARAVHNSSWEPRPDNYKRNHVLADAAAVHNSFSTRPRSGSGSYDPRWS